MYALCESRRGHWRLVGQRLGALGVLGEPWGRLWRPLGVLRGLLGASWGVLGVLGGDLGAMGEPLGFPGGSWGFLGGPWGAPWGSPRGPWRVFGTSRAGSLRGPWDVLGGPLRSWGIIWGYHGCSKCENVAPVAKRSMFSNMPFGRGWLHVCKPWGPIYENVALVAKRSMFSRIPWGTFGSSFRAHV